MKDTQASRERAAIQQDLERHCCATIILSEPRPAGNSYQRDRSLFRAKARVRELRPWAAARFPFSQMTWRVERDEDGVRFLGIYVQELKT